VINIKEQQKRILETLKFGHKSSMVKECRCPLCALRVDIKEFRSKVFIREFEMTGLCQGCLDLIYGYKVAW
jgi:hypothetical protein